MFGLVVIVALFATVIVGTVVGGPYRVGHPASATCSACCWV
jgi:hypothetical protein